jgi:hypothetical protein
MPASAWGSLSGANVLIWIGITLCITQSAIFSGLNLAISASANYGLRAKWPEATAMRPCCSIAQRFKPHLGHSPLGQYYDQRASHAIVELRPCRRRSVRFLHGRHHAIWRDHPAAYSSRKCHQNGGAARVAATFLPRGTLSDSETDSDCSQPVART